MDNFLFQSSRHALVDSFDATMSYGTSPIKVRGKAFYRLGNKHDLMMELDIPESHQMKLLFCDPDEVTLKIHGKQEFVAHVLQISNNKVTIFPNPALVESIHPNELLHTAATELINFKMKSPRQLLLNVDDWQITISNKPDIDSIFKSLKYDGGFQITHSVLITKTHGGGFTVNELREFSKVFHRFISFVDGSWVGFLGLKAFSKTDKIIYESWQAVLTHSWESKLGWIDSISGKQVENLFSGFYGLLNNDDQDKAIEKVLYWYLRSNRSSSGVDGGIILSHSALERLSSYAITKFNLKVACQNRKTSAADKIRAAANHLMVPTHINSELQVLESLKNIDGMIVDLIDLINRYRNHLVHPRPESTFKGRNFSHEVWSLAQWLIEMFILQLSNYKGLYSNRLNMPIFQGQLSPLPWVDS